MDFALRFELLTRTCYMLLNLATELTVDLCKCFQDLGFTLLPELGQENEWVSETIFSSMLISFVLWTFSPFWQESGKRFYTAVLYARVLMVLVSKLPTCHAHTFLPRSAGTNSVFVQASPFFKTIDLVKQLATSLEILTKFLSSAMNFILPCIA